MAKHQKYSSGMRFGRLIALYKSDIKDSAGAYKWVFKCDCGKETLTSIYSCAKGLTHSCGCLQKEKAVKTCKERNTSHGASVKGSFSYTYKGWRYMRDRVARDPDYKDINIDPSWHDFSKFREDMGDRPYGLQLDRLDNSKGYCKGNCKWSTAKEQQNNRTNNVLIEYLGEIRTKSQWADITRLKYNTLDARLRAGWEIGRALTEPLRRWPSNSNIGESA